MTQISSYIFNFQIQFGDYLGPPCTSCLRCQSALIHNSRQTRKQKAYSTSIARFIQNNKLKLPAQLNI